MKTSVGKIVNELGNGDDLCVGGDDGGIVVQAKWKKTNLIG